MRKNRLLRMFLALLLIPSLLISFPAHSLGEELIGSEEELLSVLSRGRAQGVTELRVTLTGGYFSRISENSFQEYSAVKLKAGIADCSLKYSEQGFVLYLENIQWTEPHAVEASTEQEFRRAFQYYLEAGVTEFQIIIRDKRLFESLQHKGRAFEYAAMYGAESIRVRTVSVPPYIFYLDEIQPFTLPWHTVSSRDEWIRAVESMAARNAGHFWLILDPFFAESLHRNEDLIRQMEAASPMATWSMSYRTDYTRFEFKDVVFTDEPRVECGTEEEVTEAIRQMGGSGRTAFTLLLTPELFAAVSADEFAKLHALEADAGLSDREVAYSAKLGTLSYSNAVIHSNAVKLGSLQEVSARLAQAAADGEERITLFCTPEVYNLLIGDMTDDTGSGSIPAPICDALAHAGVYRFTYTCSQSSHIVQINVTELYTGTKLLLAASREDYSGLTQRELATLDTARHLAQECRSGDPLTTARRIHDALCARIQYTTDDSTDEKDTAAGALLNGQADCDGYADAFYLTGTLAGLNVRYQHGNSKEKGTDERYRDVTHMWNLVEIGGTWRLVDVTWDDQDNGIVYTWFNIGADRAKRMHLWNEEMSVPIAGTTLPDERPEREYLVGNPEDAAGAVRNAAAEGVSPFTLVFPADSNVSREEVRDILRMNMDRSFSYEWNEYMHMVRVSTED